MVSAFISSMLLKLTESKTNDTTISNSSVSLSFPPHNKVLHVQKNGGEGSPKEEFSVASLQMQTLVEQSLIGLEQDNVCASLKAQTLLRGLSIGQQVKVCAHLQSLVSSCTDLERKEKLSNVCASLLAGGLVQENGNLVRETGRLNSPLALFLFQCLLKTEKGRYQAHKIFDLFFKAKKPPFSIREWLKTLFGMRPSNAVLDYKLGQNYAKQLLKVALLSPKRDVFLKTRFHLGPKDPSFEAFVTKTREEVLGATQEKNSLL